MLFFIPFYCRGGALPRPQFERIARFFCDNCIIVLCIDPANPILAGFGRGIAPPLQWRMELTIFIVETEKQVQFIMNCTC